MPRNLFPSRLLGALLLSGILTTPAWAQPATPPAETPAAQPPAAQPQNAEKESETPAAALNLPTFDPKADPAETLKAVEKCWDTNITGASPEEEQEQTLKVLRTIIQGAEVILENEEAKEEIALDAMRHKMQALGILARAGDPTAPPQALGMARDLSEDKRPSVAREAKLILISNRLREIPEMEADARKEFVKELIALLGTGELSEREVQIANITASLLEQTGDNAAAQSLFEQTAALLKKAKSPAVRAQAAEFEGAGKRLGLPGNTMQLTGETLKGEKFDLKDLKGKVVLVQFWASWCTYCLQEMPHIRQAYNTYHDEGFEVIGVNLDESASRAQEIIDEMQLPWPQLFSKDPEALGMNNPNAVNYGITGIPLCVLIDREGKVVTLQARGKTLDEELEKLFLEKK